MPLKNFIIYFILREIFLQPSPLCGTTRVRPKTTERKTSIILEVLQTPLRKPNVPNRLGGENGRHNLSVSQSEARQGRVQSEHLNALKHPGPSFIKITQMVELSMHIRCKKIYLYITYIFIFIYKRFLY